MTFMSVAERGCGVCWSGLAVVDGALPRRHLVQDNCTGRGLRRTNFNHRQPPSVALHGGAHVFRSQQPPLTPIKERDTGHFRATPMKTAAPKARRSQHAIGVSVRVRPSAYGTPAAVLSQTFASAVVTGSDQAQTYGALGSELVSRLRAGYSCTLLAYGQTGSGKTYTMFGPSGCLPLRT